MNKKSYRAPTVRKVRLVVKDAILAVCHVSPAMDPRGGESVPCEINPGCWRAP